MPVENFIAYFVPVLLSKGLRFVSVLLAWGGVKRTQGLLLLRVSSVGWEFCDFGTR